jgi:hypothetical protein
VSLLLLFRPFGGVAPPAPPVVVVEEPGGVRKGRKREFLRVRLSEFNDKQRAAEYIKAQLRLRQAEPVPTPAEPEKPAQPRLSKADKAKQSALASEALRNMEIEAANEQRRIIDAQNEEILKLILLSSL